jgi:hypothetical protein
MFPMIRKVAVLILVTASCAHRQPPIDLQAALTLRVVEAPDRVVAGLPIEVSFGVKNSSGVPLSLCSPGGVSMQLRSERPGDVWPIVLHGFTTDTHCSGPFELRPGEEKVFLERGAIRRGLPSGSWTMVGFLSLSCDPRMQPTCRDVQLEVSKVIQCGTP